MKYKSFQIENYRAILGPIDIPIEKYPLMPLIGANESGKTSILQAIFAFDYANDSEYESYHLKNTRNLYKPGDKSPARISATISFRPGELSACLEPGFKDKYPWLGKSRVLIITRLLPDNEKPYYSIKDIDDADADVIANSIVRRLPYIIYSDDFIERPDTVLEIPDQVPEPLSGWLGIYEQAFRKASTSLFSVIDENSNIRNSLLSDVASEINNLLVKEWARISIDNGDCLRISLGLENRNLIIKIVEVIGGKERFFDITERSKGFLWFFNFVMKIRYNPKATGHTSDIVYLFDEPGSYLHAAAQEKLCKMLNSISKKEGIVVYCTHTHHLLNPKYIPPKNAFLLQKNGYGEIGITRVVEAKTKSKKNSEIQPYIEALGIADWDFFISHKKILLVEGLYDKYALELFCEKELSNYIVFPGTSASSILERIPQCIAFDKDYYAIWDNDEEGRAIFDKATQKFGMIEAKRFHVLPKNSGTGNIRMESFIGREALREIQSILGLQDNTTYEKTLIATICLSEKEKDNLLSNFKSTVLPKFKSLAESLEVKSSSGAS